MALDGLSQLPPAVRTLLGQGEKALLWKSVALAFGDERLGQTGKVRAVEGVDFRPSSLLTGTGPISWESGLGARLVGGISLTGGTGSAAAGLAAALDRASNPRLCVTDRRLILFDEGATTFGTDQAGAKTWDSEVEQLWACERAALASARRRSRPFMHGRVVLTFTDGSTIALLTGVLSPLAANRICRTLRPGE